MRPNARGDLPGPGDVLPPDPPQLDDVFLERAYERLVDLFDGPPPRERVDALAWELQDEARRQAERDRLDARDADAIDAYDAAHPY